MKKFIVRLLPVVLIVAACAVFFYPTFTKGLLPAPTDTLIGLYHPWLDQASVTSPSGVPFKNFLITDPVRQQIPWRKLAIDAIRSGALTAWNPYNFSGTPLSANIQAGMWYPMNLIFFFLPFYVAWTILIIAQPLLAALFLFLYLRSKNITPILAAFAGVVWAFSGFSVAWLTWGTIVQTALWLPLMMLATDTVMESADRKRGVLWSAVLTASASATILSGHIQVALYALLFMGVYALFGMWNSLHRKRVLWLFGALAAAAAITSIQWVPMLELLSHSSRFTDTTGWLKDGWFLPWQHLVQFVAPDFFGNPATLNYWGVWNYGEFIGYIGIVPLLFAIYSIVTRKDRLTRFFALVLGITLLFLLPTPLALLPYEKFVPVWSSLQPTRLMVLVDFCLAMLMILGAEAYFKRPSKKILLPVGFVGIILAGLWVFVLRSPIATQDAEVLTNLAVSRRNLMLPSILWLAGGVLLILPLLTKRWNKIFMVAVIGLTMFDLFRFGWKFTPFTPVEYFFPVTKAMSFLQSQQKPFRVMSLDNRILPPNVNAYYGVESIEGYDPVYDGRYEEFIAALNRREPNITPPFGFNRIITSPTSESALLPLLNVKYVLALADVDNPAFELMYREGNTRVYWYKKSLPRIYAVETTIESGSKQHTIDLLYDKKFNPEKQAVVEGYTAMSSVPLTDGDTVRVTAYSPSLLTATTTFTSERFVVVSNVYDPHWVVTIDGDETPVYRTDYTFLGFRVPEGDHLIKVSYE